MEIEIKTLQNIRDNRVKLEIIIDRDEALTYDPDDGEQLRGLLRDSTHKLGEIQRIVNHEDVTSALNSTTAPDREFILARSVHNVQSALTSQA